MVYDGYQQKRGKVRSQNHQGHPQQRRNNMPRFTENQGFFMANWQNRCCPARSP